MKNIKKTAENLHEIIKEKDAQIVELKTLIKYYEEQLKLSKKRQFGASSEKSEYDQMSLFNEAEVSSDSNTPEPELVEVEKHYRNKSRTINRLPEDLPVETIEYELPENERTCPECGEDLHVMGRGEPRRELKIIPAQVVVVEHIQKIYACRNCEKNAEIVPIIKAKAPAPVIKGSFASPETVAHIATQKFVMGAPLYRQEQDWKRQGIEISRQSMSNWLIRSAETWLEPIYNELKKRLVNRDVLHADETTIQVLREPGKTPQSKSYMWLYRTSGDTDKGIVLYEYQPDRKYERPKTFLKGFKGYLHTDGYEGYHKLPSCIIVSGCWSHARRKWDEALKTIPKKDWVGSKALQGKAFCDKLFKIERDLKKLIPEERYKKRLELAKPVIDEFYEWLKTVNALPQSSLGKAVYYMHSQRKYLENYLLDGRLEISNNRAEISIKPFVIDRKNFLFSNTPKGARSSSVIFSLIETAKENGLNPFTYLSYIFRNAPNLDLNNLETMEALLPWNAPDSCKVSSTR